MTIAIISHSQCFEHDMDVKHPESKERLVAIQQSLQVANFKSVLSYYDAPLILPQYLAQIHSQEYLAHLEAVAPTQPNEGYWLDGDTCVMHHTLAAASRAAGAAIYAVDLVMSQKVQAAFCAVRPPGHHAKRSKAMGFCFYNNVAAAAMYAVEQHNLARVAIVDFDVHHGNGTEDIVTGDARILLCSSFQHPFYPYEGANSKADNICNLPLPAGTDGETFRREITKKFLPRLLDFKPQLVIFSAGFDGHADDNMSMFGLLEADYAWVTTQVKAVADQYAEGRIVSCLEGGYNLVALSSSVIAHLGVLAT